MDPSSLKPELVNVTGSLSGFHSCNIILADDKKTILIYPKVQFTEGETIVVSVLTDSKRNRMFLLTALPFNFRSIHPNRFAKGRYRASPPGMSCRGLWNSTLFCR
jgi:hypothetical protein